MSLLILLLAAAAPASQAETREVSIPFVNSDGIQEWRADGDRGLFVRGGDARWYYARTMGACGRLRTAQTIGFETRNDRLDRFGVLRVEGWRCPLQSLTRSEPPPSRRRR
jgi:hypothetical protein